MAEAAKVACEEAKEVKKKEQDEKVARLAAARVEKQYYREAENKQKKLYNYSKEAREQPHKRLHQKLSVHVVQWRCQGVQKLVRLQRLHCRNCLRAGVRSRNHVNLNSTKVLHCSIYNNPEISLGNSFCGWCCSLISAEASKLMGAASREVRHYAHQHGSHGSGCSRVWDRSRQRSRQCVS
jgi:hypothetical protein